jgi:hypothetical protein
MLALYERVNIYDQRCKSLKEDERTYAYEDEEQYQNRDDHHYEGGSAHKTTPFDQVSSAIILSFNQRSCQSG